MHGRANVLVVDDEPAASEYVAAILGLQGYATSTVSTAEDALRAMKESPVDLMVLDAALGQTDGLEVLARVKAAHPELPVIMLSGNNFEDKRATEARRQGATAYLSKTLAPGQLMLEARNALRAREKTR
ncbi:MAG: response regulator [Verrucomicrobiota bacterium]